MEPPEGCMGCATAAGKHADEEVYRDGRVVAVVAQHAINPGHLVIVTREHVRNALTMPEELHGHMARVAARLGRALREALPCSGIMLVFNNEAPCQTLFHAHLHVVPRHAGDEMDRKFGAAVPPEERRAMAARLRARAGGEIARAEAGKPGCLFCRLAGSEGLPFLLPAGEETVAFPALHPVREGQLVVVPREHHERAAAIPAPAAADMFRTGAVLGEALRELLGCPGYTLALHDGPPGQPAPHAHLSVIPRSPGDPLDLPRPPEADRGDLRALAERLRARLETGTPAAAEPGRPHECEEERER